MLIATLQLQNVLGFTVLSAGLFFLFMSGSVATASFIAPVLERRIGVVSLLRCALLLQSIGVGLLFFVDDPIFLAVGLFLAGFGCSWGWALPQAGAIRSLPREKSGLASGSILTIMVMCGNTAFVVMAMVIDLYPDDAAGEAFGIRAAAGWSCLLGVLGLLCSLVLLRRATRVG